MPSINLNNFDDNNPAAINSPRSLVILRANGVNPELDLKILPPHIHKVGSVPSKIAERRREHHEKTRQELISQLREEYENGGEEDYQDYSPVVGQSVGKSSVSNARRTARARLIATSPVRARQKEMREQQQFALEKRLQERADRAEEIKRSTDSKIDYVNRRKQERMSTVTGFNQNWADKREGVLERGEQQTQEKQKQVIEGLQQKNELIDVAEQRKNQRLQQQAMKAAQLADLGDVAQRGEERFKEKLEKAIDNVNDKEQKLMEAAQRKQGILESYQGRTFALDQRIVEAQEKALVVEKEFQTRTAAKLEDVNRSYVERKAQTAEEKAWAAELAREVAEDRLINARRAALAYAWQKQQNAVKKVAGKAMRM